MGGIFFKAFSPGLCCWPQQILVSESPYMLHVPQDDEWFIESPTLFILNAVAAGICLMCAGAAMLHFGGTLVKTKLSGKQWSRRRLFFCSTSYTQVVVVETLPVFSLVSLEPSDDVDDVSAREYYLADMQLVVQSISCFMFLLPNIWVLARDCQWFGEVSEVNPVLTCARCIPARSR